MLFIRRGSLRAANYVSRHGESLQETCRGVATLTQSRETSFGERNVANTATLGKKNIREVEHMQCVEYSLAFSRCFFSQVGL